MRKKTYLAFDLGASNSRALLGTLKNDVMTLEELHRFTTPVIEEGDSLFWDEKTIWNELKFSLQKALQEAPDLRSLSVDSWGVDYIPLLSGGTPARHPYCYRDPRTNGVKERAFETLSEEQIYSKTGIQFLPFNTLYQLLADLEEDRQALGTIWKHLTIADYFNYRFCGNPVIERSMASTTQLMDISTRNWSESLMQSFGLKTESWPSIVPSGTDIGSVTGNSGARVIASCSHDTGSAVAATPVQTGNSWAYISCGTWSLIGVERIHPLLSDSARKSGFTHEAGIDNTLRFLKNLTGLWVLQECVRDWKSEKPVNWSDLVEEAGRAEPAKHQLDLDDPSFLARGGMEARLLDYCLDHNIRQPSSRGQLVRLILESIAHSYLDALTDLEDLTGKEIDTIHLFGGGSQNQLLCQLTADICRKRVISGPVEATALGNLLIQARTLGDLPEGVSIRDISAHSSELKTFLPSKAIGGE
jgi:rhamnulokinase